MELLGHSTLYILHDVCRGMHHVLCILKHAYSRQYETTFATNFRIAPSACFLQLRTFGIEAIVVRLNCSLTKICAWVLLVAFANYF